MLAWTLLLIATLLLAGFVATLVPGGLAARRDGRKRIVFFDGDCGLCSRTVRFLLRVDRHGILRFAPLQGRTAQLLLPGTLREQALESTLVYYREGPGPGRRAEHLIRDDAVLAIYDDLGGALRLLGIGRWLPRGLREKAYRFVAHNRRRLFSGGACPLDTAAARKRVLP